MLEINNKYTFEIIDNGMNFEGIAKSEEGLTVFVPETLVGEKVEAKVVKVNKSYALAKVQRYIQESNVRQEEDCEYHKLCGGCVARHTTYENSLEIKKNNVISVLKKQGISEEKIQDVYGMGNPYHYRNKVQYPVRNVNGKMMMGMFSQASHNIVENEYCLIQDKQTHDVAKKLFKLLVNNNFSGYDEKTGAGDIRNVMVRRGTNTGEIMCVLVVNSRTLIHDNRLLEIAKQLMNEDENIVSFILNINDKNTNVILSNENVCIVGRDYITDIIGEYTFKITADSFFQVNTIQAELLYNVLKCNMEFEKDKTLLELYSGVGTIGIFLSDSVKDIYSVEIVKSAVLAAKENAKINDVKNIINVNGDATEETLKIVKQGKTFDYLVVDPPRKGLDLEGVELILKLKPKKIGYVSCNPATLARDLKLLSNDYNIQKIDLVDMFPWTSHVECVSLLCRK